VFVLFCARAQRRSEKLESSHTELSNSVKGDHLTEQKPVSKKGITSRHKKLIAFTTIIVLLATIPLVINILSSGYTKGQIIRTLIKENIKRTGTPHTILIVNSSALTGVQIASEIYGVPVKVINQAQLDSMERDFDSLNAIRFNEVVFWPFGFCYVWFSTSFNSYWPGFNGGYSGVVVGCYSVWWIWNLEGSFLV
jgi:hypothetical protein